MTDHVSFIDPFCIACFALHVQFKVLPAPRVQGRGRIRYSAFISFRSITKSVTISFIPASSNNTTILSPS